MSEGFNGAGESHSQRTANDMTLTHKCPLDLRNICTEAGMFAIRDDRDYVTQDDFMKGARKQQEVRPIPRSDPLTLY